jgi:hypothetical protein
MRRWFGPALRYGFALIVLALVLYVAAYATFIERVSYHFNDKRLHPRYNFGGATSEMLFAPAQAIDERLFPGRWMNRREAP